MTNNFSRAEISFNFITYYYECTSNTVISLNLQKSYKVSLTDAAPKSDCFAIHWIHKNRFRIQSGLSIHRSASKATSEGLHIRPHLPLPSPASLGLFPS